MFIQDEDVRRATVASKGIEAERNERRNAAQDRINAILVTNGLKEIEIARDDNCIFTATVSMVADANPHLTPHLLRWSLE